MAIDPTTASDPSTLYRPIGPAATPSLTSVGSGDSSGSAISGASSGPGLGTDTIASSATPTLGPGSSGPSVRAVQTMVGATPDGIYGPKTTGAVERFQARSGLTPDGVVGPKTWNALTGGERTLESGSRGAAVADVQRLVGVKPDGVYGPATQQAVEAYQSSRGLTADGIVGPQTWNALTSGAPAKASPTQPPTSGQPATQPPTSGQPATQPPTSGQPATQPPTSGQPATQPPTSGQPATQPPTSGQPATQPPTSGQPATQPTGSGNGLVDTSKDYLTKLAQYFTNPINDIKQVGSVASKFGRRDFDALKGAAEANKAFADRIRNVVNGFDSATPAENEKAIQGLLDTVKGGKQNFAPPDAVHGVARDLRAANAAPTPTEGGTPVGGEGTPVVGEGAPTAGENAPTTGTPKVTAATKTDDVVNALEDAATKQAAKAASPLTKALRAIGTTPDDLTGGTKIPLVGNVPILNLAATAYGTVHDADKVGAPDSAVANIGSMYASQLGGRAVQNALVDTFGKYATSTVGETVAGGLAEAGGTAAAETAGTVLAGAATDLAVAGGAELGADALVGAAVASGPAGWAILAGVGAGIAIGVGVKAVVESKAGQDIINGAFHGNLDQVGHGFVEAGQDIESLGQGAYDLGKSAVSGAAHLGADAIDEGKKALHSIGSFLGL